jgi:hypothetical protein
VNWHQIIDERNYEMDQVVASVLRHDPTRLDLVVDWIRKRLEDPDFSVHSKDGLKEWLDLIQARGLPGVLEVLGDRSGSGLRLRQSSPFGVLMPQEERLKIIRRYEALRPRAHPAGI